MPIHIVEILVELIEDGKLKFKKKGKPERRLPIMTPASLAER